MPIEIIEVLRRSEQGITRPFICRGDDGEVYFVKGVGAGRKSQLSEWIAGKLALSLGLPIAPFEIVDVPEELIDEDGPNELSDLGSGPAFGSQLNDEVMEITTSVVPDVPDEVQQDVLVFDWWVRNGDRMLTEQGGNPNLFWEPELRELVVIDHNQAFDPLFDPCNFLDFHVFTDQHRDVFADMLKRRQYNQRFSAALDGWDGILEAIPEEWLFSDPEMTVPVDFDLDLTYQLLKRYEQNDFWDMP